MPFYENSLVYKLCCNDPEISDTYIGSTCNFKARKCSHKSHCNNENSKKYNLYVYRFIRENGGWGNWSMILIKKYPEVKDMYELHHKERKWMRKLKATLNKSVPNRTKKEYYEQNKDKLVEYNKQYHEQHKDKLNENKKQ